MSLMLVCLCSSDLLFFVGWAGGRDTRGFCQLKALPLSVLLSLAAQLGVLSLSHLPPLLGRKILE